MIDAAYWHLAKRYAAIDDERSRKKLEELNEAYVVMGSADRRDAYLALRASVLGVDALPVQPPPQQEPFPLSVMERQKPRAREDSFEEEEAVRRKWYAAAISSAFAIPVVLGLAIAAFLAGASPLFMTALVIVGLLAITGPFPPSMVRFGASLRTANLALPKLRFPTTRRSPNGAPATITPIDAAKLKSSTRSRTEQLRSRKAKNGQSPAEERDPAPLEDPRD